MEAYIDNLEKEKPLLCQYISPPMRGKFSTMPDVLFWHPGAVISGQILKCPHHSVVLKDSSKWADGRNGKKRYPYRTLYGLSRNAILIPRLYSCIKCKKDYVLATHDKVMKDSTKEVPNEFLLFHQIGVTSELYHFVVNAIGNGKQ